MICANVGRAATFTSKIARLLRVGLWAAVSVLVLSAVYRNAQDAVPGAVHLCALSRPMIMFQAWDIALMSLLRYV